MLPKIALGNVRKSLRDFAVFFITLVFGVCVFYAFASINDQTAVINRLRAQAARYSDTAALFQALGGGWWNRTDVDPKSMGKPDRFPLPPVQDIRLPRAGH